MKFVGLGALGVLILGSLVIVVMNESPNISIDKSPAPANGDTYTPANLLDSSKTSTDPAATQKAVKQQPGVYTMADVKRHNSGKRGWTAINGGV